MQKVFKIKIQNKEIEIIQDVDGLFIKPDFVREMESIGTTLKPALEPICVARKPISEKTVAENVLKWGTGGINIDECRVEATKEDMGDWDRFKGYQNSNTIRKNMVDNKTEDFEDRVDNGVNSQGRFPANLIHDGSDEVVELFPYSTSGARKISDHKDYNASSYKFGGLYSKNVSAEGGSASRFFYCAKASKSERNRGCEGLEEKTFGFSGGANGAIDRGEDYDEGQEIGLNRVQKMKNNHPTVKPIALMEYLIKLVSREGAIVLDPFLGSGTTAIACKNLKRNWIGIEREEEYVKIAEARIKGVPERLL